MNASSLMADLHAAAPLIAPSLLACDFANLEREIDSVTEAGARILHLDVMDGHFVPNISIGVPIVEAARRVARVPLEAHLMISEPARYVEAFREAGADLITFHVEAVPDPSPLLRKIRRLGALAGVAISPPTPVTALESCLQDCDLVLVMTVMPGFGGQHFRSEEIEKIRWLSTQMTHPILLSVDGGINDQTIGLCAAAGAGMFVVGTGLFGHPDYRGRLAELREAAKSTSVERI